MSTESVFKVGKSFRLDFEWNFERTEVHIRSFLTYFNAFFRHLGRGPSSVSNTRATKASSFLK